jgi:branched-chain amino acid transport system permease protein
VSVTDRDAQPSGDPLADLSEQVSAFFTRPRVYSQHQWWWWAAVAVFAGFIPQIWSGGYYNNIEIDAGLYMLVALGFYLQFALAGQFSFATMAYYATGAYIFAWAVSNYGFFWAFVFAVVVTAVFGGLTKLLLYRSPLIHFAIATLAVAGLAGIVYEHVLVGITGGDQGRFGIPTPSLFGYQFDNEVRQYYLIAAVVMVVLALLIFFERSPGQRDTVFARDMGPVARNTGLRVNWIQITGFAAGAGIIGAAGVLLASTSGFVGIDTFSISTALTVLLFVLLGGIGSIWGPVLGVIALYVLPQVFLSHILVDEDIIYAAAILLVILFLPGGLTSLPTEITMRYRAIRVRLDRK